MPREIFNLGEIPSLGEIPRRMHAQVIRRERFGEPRRAFQREEVPVPPLGPRECLILVMAAGINYNNVWAAKGSPIDVISQRMKKGEGEDFHIGGSDASGVVWAVGAGVKNAKVGDEVVVHCGWWDADDPWVKEGRDPMLAPSQRIWGYETNWGSFAQFAKVKDHQCLPKPDRLSWEEAACYLLVGATAYRMLHGWKEHSVQREDVVLIWGGAGGLGSMATQIVREAGGIPVAVVSEEDKIPHCRELGAKGVINRKGFTHWGPLPDWRDPEAYGKWLEGVRSFGKAIWEAIGEKKNPRIVLEHPGESTLPTSLFVCDSGGMVVICAGTTGYLGTVDLRYHWMRQKRLQGSHFANTEQARRLNDLVAEGRISPCLSQTFSFDETGKAHQLMDENRHPPGNMAILVGAPRRGLKNFQETLKNAPRAGRV